MVDEISRSLETFVAVPALESFRHLMNVLYMLLQSISVWRFFPAIAASVVEFFGSVILAVPVIRLNVCKEVSADFTTNSVFVPSTMRLHVLVHGILRSESLGANFTDFKMSLRMSVILQKQTIT